MELTQEDMDRLYDDKNELIPYRPINSKCCRNLSCKNWFIPKNKSCIYCTYKCMINSNKKSITILRDFKCIRELIYPKSKESDLHLATKYLIKQHKKIMSPNNIMLNFTKVFLEKKVMGGIIDVLGITENNTSIYIEVVVSNNTFLCEKIGRCLVIDFSEIKNINKITTMSDLYIILFETTLYRTYIRRFK